MSGRTSLDGVLTLSLPLSHANRAHISLFWRFHPQLDIPCPMSGYRWAPEDSRPISRSTDQQRYTGIRSCESSHIRRVPLQGEC